MSYAHSLPSSGSGIQAGCAHNRNSVHPFAKNQLSLTVHVPLSMPLISYHSFSVLDSFICLWLSLCSAVFVPHSLLVKDNAIMLCQESSPSFERLEIHSSFTGPKMGTISVFPPVLTYSVSVYHLSFWHIQVVFAGSGAKIRRENFEVYHRTLMVLLNLVVKHQVPPSMAGCIKLLSSLFSKRTPNGKEHRQSPEKCAAGLQQLIDLSRGDRSEKCHEVFCIFLYGNFAEFCNGTIWQGRVGATQEQCPHPSHPATDKDRHDQSTAMENGLC